MLLAKILALLIIIFIASIFLNKNVVKLDYKLYRILIFPGIALHEIAHILGCMITGSRILDAQIFSTTGGYVKHTGGRLGHFGNWIISFAPIIAGFFVSFGIFYLARSLTVFNAGSIALILFLVYLELSVFLTMSPSPQDLSNSILGTILVLALLFLLEYFNLFEAYLFEFYKFLIIIVILEFVANAFFIIAKKFIKK